MRTEATPIPAVHELSPPPGAVATARETLRRALLICGVLSSVYYLAIDGPNVAADLPTPWIGLWERINIGVGMLWLAVLAIALLRGKAYENVVR